MDQTSSRKAAPTLPSPSSSRREGLTERQRAQGREEIRDLRSFRAADLLKLQKQAETEQSERRKQTLRLDIDRSGACGYWLSSFPSAS